MWVTGKTRWWAFVLGLCLQFLDPAQRCETFSPSLCNIGTSLSTDTVAYVRDKVSKQLPASAGKINADRVIKTPKWKPCLIQSSQYVVWLLIKDNHKLTVISCILVVWSKKKYFCIKGPCTSHIKNINRSLACFYICRMDLCGAYAPLTRCSHTWCSQFHWLRLKHNVAAVRPWAVRRRYVFHVAKA